MTFQYFFIIQFLNFFFLNLPNYQEPFKSSAALVLFFLLIDSRQLCSFWKDRAQIQIIILHIIECSASKVEMGWKRRKKIL